MFKSIFIEFKGTLEAPRNHKTNPKPFSKIGPAATLFTSTRMRSIARLQSILPLACTSIDCAHSLAWALEHRLGAIDCIFKTCSFSQIFPLSPIRQEMLPFLPKNYKTKKTQKENKISQNNKTKKLRNVN